MEKLKPGTRVESQGFPVDYGVVLDEHHPDDGWVWVMWERIGRWDEYVPDLTVSG